MSVLMQLGLLLVAMTALAIKYKRILMKYGLK